MRFQAIITDPDEVKKVLRHLVKTGKPPPGLGVATAMVRHCGRPD
jgi:hypothetical protein